MARNYTIEEMKAEKKVLEPIYDAFIDELDKRLANNKGILSMQQMEFCISTAMKTQRLGKEQKKVVNAFFDTFLGAWGTGGREMAESVAFTILANMTDGDTRVYFF
ncbi:hypothetical protein bcere0029_54370 [Bacillus cereus AH1272]|nr:hypothetical protein bcere0029_54370 [Bacillus cereus AH1272]